MFIEAAIASGSPPPSRSIEARNRRQKCRKDDAGRAAVDGDQPGHERDHAGDRAWACASLASAAVNRSRPPVRSISEISTVTPLIITNHRPRHLLHRFLVIGGAGHRQDHRAGECAHPDVHAEEQHARQQRRDDRHRDHDCSYRTARPPAAASIVTTEPDVKSFSPPNSA